MNLVIQQHKDLQQAVEAKQLYAELGLNSAHWAKWSQRNILNNEFAVDGLDYEGFTQWVNGNLTQNFLLAIPFAKKLAMQVKTQKGEDELEGSHYTKNVVKNQNGTESVVYQMLRECKGFKTAQLASLTWIQKGWKKLPPPKRLNTLSCYSVNASQPKATISRSR